MFSSNQVSPYSKSPAAGGGEIPPMTHRDKRHSSVLMLQIMDALKSADGSASIMFRENIIGCSCGV